MNDSTPPIHTRTFTIKGLSTIESMVKNFTATEKALFAILVTLCVASVISMLWNINQAFLVKVPAHGGSIIEGVVGIPRFINPILAITDADRDLTTLVYSGLMRHSGSTLVPDLAESYTVSDDGLLYTFTLRKNIYFHDDTPVTADDVVFTIEKALDSTLKSPRRANWDTIKVEKVNTSQIRFILQKPYEPFLENTTIGIIPKHIWKNVDADQFTFSQYNIEPIGAGPYKLEAISRDKGGLPLSYELRPWKKFHMGEAFISQILVYFYPNERDLIDAYNEGTIQSMNSISPKEAKRLNMLSPSINIKLAPLPRIFGIFFNQNQNTVLANKEVRLALSAAVNRDRIVQEVLGGYGHAITSPLPLGIAATSTATTERATSTDAHIAEARSILEKAGWTISTSTDGIYEKRTKKDIQTLELSLTTSNAPELKRTAELIKEQWERLGARVTLRIFESGDLNQNVIRPRKYDALLFGEIIGRDLDLFAFWHSSQRNDPGLNIALYANSTVDKLLEDIRISRNSNDKFKKYAAVEKAIMSDMPAVFLYSPDFIYILPKDVNNADLNFLTTAADRWNTIATWYIDTDSVWKIFTKNTTLYTNTNSPN